MIHNQEFRFGLVVLFVLLFTRFESNAQDSFEFEFATYEYNSTRLDSKDDLKIYRYLKLYSDGKVEIMNEEGELSSVQIEKKLIDDLIDVTSSGINKFKNTVKPKPNQYYAGKYSFLKKDEESICFNPYGVDKQLKTALSNIVEAIKNKKATKESKSFEITDELIKSIKQTHNSSNLKPIAPPPPMSE